MKQFIQKWWKRLLHIFPGVIVSGPNTGGAAEIEGPLEVLFASLVGGGIGFVAGLLIGVIVRLITIGSANGSRGGMHWAAYGAVAGAMALGIMELLD